MFKGRVKAAPVVVPNGQTVRESEIRHVVCTALILGDSRFDGHVTGLRPFSTSMAV